MDKEELARSLNVRLSPGGSPDKSLVEVVEGAETITVVLGKIEQVNGIVIPPGKVTGNHYHKIKGEIFGVIYGAIRAIVYDQDSGVLHEDLVEAGHMFTVHPGIVHSLHNTTYHPTFIVEVANKRFRKENPQDDVYKFPIVDVFSGRNLY